MSPSLLPDDGLAFLVELIYRAPLLAQPKVYLRLTITEVAG